MQIIDGQTRWPDLRHGTLRAPVVRESVMFHRKCTRAQGQIDSPFCAWDSVVSQGAGPVGAETARQLFHTN